MKIYDMKKDKGEVHVRKSKPESTVWDDGEEPEPAVADTHVGENMKTRIKEADVVPDLASIASVTHSSLGRLSLPGMLSKTNSHTAKISGKRSTLTSKASLNPYATVQK